MSKRINRTVEKILFIFRKFINTRNCDWLLLTKIMETYYNDRLYLAKDGHYYLRLDKLPDIMYDLGDFQRYRARIQNEDKMYLPTSEEVRKKRRISEEDHRQWCLADRGIMDI